MKITIIIIVLILIIVLIIFHPAINLRVLLQFIRPFKSFDAVRPPVPPDYDDPETWAALPSKDDVAGKVPKRSDLKDDQDHAEADVFYVHRTTLLSNTRWNANVKSRRLNKRTDREAIRNQASIFNESCKVFSPRYRQATLYSFFDKSGSGAKALDLAYQDIKKAFSHYLEHYNAGRPIVLAAHSQGAEHAQRLLHDFFDDKELHHKLVIAYLVGMPVSENTFKIIPPGDHPSQIGCFVSWSTFGWGIQPNYFQAAYQNAVCTNPLTWNKNADHGGIDLHLGGVPMNFKRIDKNFIEARCVKGVLWVRNRKLLRYMPFSCCLLFSPLLCVFLFFKKALVANWRNPPNCRRISRISAFVNHGGMYAV
ncbi:MAG: DUF3089 domain-containing protein [Bacteroidota bacterium]